MHIASIMSESGSEPVTGFVATPDDGFRTAVVCQFVNEAWEPLYAVVLTSKGPRRTGLPGCFQLDDGALSVLDMARVEHEQS